jgi:hypothetical protein
LAWPSGSGAAAGARWRYFDFGSQNAVANAKARAQEAERLAEEEDDAVIASMNAKRVETGRTR